MKTDDEFVGAFIEVGTFLREARRDQVAEALRLVACEVAYCGRYHERPSLDALTARIAEAGKYPASMALVVEGMAHLKEVLVRLRVTAPEATPTRTVEDMGKDGESRHVDSSCKEAVSVKSDVDWFGAGWAVYKCDVRDAEFFPPLNDMEAQRWWLGGFGAAWAERTDDETLEFVLHGVGLGGESVEQALARALTGREELLRQLRSHREGWGSRTMQ